MQEITCVLRVPINSKNVKKFLVKNYIKTIDF